MLARRVLHDFDIEQVRFQLERDLAAALEELPGFAARRRSFLPTDPGKIRRRLLAEALRLTESMAPQAYLYARETMKIFGVDGTVEIFQASGRENAALHLVKDPILLEVQGRMLTLLDEQSGLALFGHELGHYLAHGPWNELGATLIAGAALADHGLFESEQVELARRGFLAREVTADRMGLLACQDLDAALRLEMVATTGLAGDALTWDTKAYLEQSKELMRSLLESGDKAHGITHPEHSLRAWAVWLFSETDVYRKLTGRGPGVRKLAEVDELITRALGGAAIDEAADTREEPPPFLLECALACCVLVALADGDMAPEELEAIEDAFSSRVPGWSELLDHEIALDRFYETGGLVSTGGVGLARRLFLLMTHVMGADENVDAREVQMIIAIGEALNFARQFRAWLEPALKAMGVEVETDLEARLGIPLPARKAEVANALSALCDSVDRSREARISPRRLLKLAGAKGEDDLTALTRVAKFFDGRGVEVAPALETAHLDELVRLRSTKIVELSREAPPELTADRKALIAALSRLREELISGDGRSPSVRLRSAKRAARVFDLNRLDSVRAGAAERTIMLVQQGKKATLVTPEDAGRQDGARACAEDLRRLDRENWDRREETGANDLYVGYPVLLGSVGPNGTSVGYAVRAPLVLFPVELERDSRGARGFSVRPRKDEDPIANQSLLRLIFNKANLAMPEQLARDLDDIVADPARGVPELVKQLGEIGLKIAIEGNALGPFRERNDDIDGKGNFLAIEECALLGIFPQSNSDLLQDYDAIIKELSSSEAELGPLLSAGWGLLPSELRTGEPPATVAHEPGWPVVPADPSQRAVAQVCAQNVVTVVDGPPGTGKSQLIVNLVADALRRGARVAVVAEKRAALDVVSQRLTMRGLGEALAVVHDVNDDRKPLYQKVAHRLKSYAPQKADTARLEVLRREHRNTNDLLERRRQTLATRPDRVENTVGELLATAAAGEDLLQAGSMVDLDRAGILRLIELAERVHPLADLWRPTSWWRSHGERPRLDAASDHDLAHYSRALDAAIENARKHDELLHVDDIDEVALRRGREAITSLDEALGLTTTQAAEAALAALARHPSEDPTAVAESLAGNASALAVWRSPVAQTDDDFRRSTAVLTGFGSRFGRFFSPLWWRSRRTLRSGLATVWPEKAGAPLTPELLAEVSSRVQAGDTWKGVTDYFQRIDIAEHAPTDAESTKAFVDLMTQLYGALQQARGEDNDLRQLGVVAPTNLDEIAPLRARLKTRLEQLSASDGIRVHTDEVEHVFPWAATASLGELQTLRERLRSDGHRLREADGWFGELRPLYADAANVLDALAESLPEEDATAWREALVRAWASAHLTRQEAFLPLLAELGSKTDEQRTAEAAEKLRSLETEIASLEVGAIRARLDEAELLQVPDAAYRARRTPKQRTKETLVKETSKSRQLISLRRLVREYADAGVLDVLPCWLLSPETMAILFPRLPLFDLVIFDEASQCTVESGLPVFLRARQVVVAGDEKQMPPTSYFKLGASGTEDDDRTEDEVRTRDMFAAESLLALARTRCPHAGLKWHYRCREEELIAFSNHSMYEGDLLTIPSTSGPASAPALKWVKVDDGDYDAGMNRPEARRVVDLVAELLQREPRPSLGVVTFNLKQRQTILEFIDDRCAKDSDFSKRWKEASTVAALDERPFVKNLESVQGDERDIIVFSLGHAPVQRKRKSGKGELYVPARFGPLGQKGGERRLNVAISRAKAQCYVVSSFDPKLLHVGDSTHSGPRLFKGFLEFAHALADGRFNVAERILDEVRGLSAVADSGSKLGPVIDGHVPLPTQIMLELEKRGYRCQLNVGTSEFRVPLAVARSKDPGDGFCVAVMTDEGSAGASAFEQFVHRPAVLELRGWTVVHVDAATWKARSSDVLALIESALESRRATSASR